MYKITDKAIVPMDATLVVASPTKKGYRISLGSRGRNGGSFFFLSSTPSSTFRNDTTVLISNWSASSWPCAQLAP